MLTVSNVEVVYDKVILVLKGVSLSVQEGKVVALLGANGAGKSTTLKAISGLLGTELGEITHGTIEFEGKRIESKTAQEISRRGIIQAMEGRRLYTHLSVEENLKAAAYIKGHKFDLKSQIEHIYDYFPVLRKYRNNISGYLSGGEQQMLVIGRSLISKPKMILLDEPSLGLAPILVQDIFMILKKINLNEKVSMIIVEQNARVALEIAHYGHVMENGRIVLDAPSSRLMENEDVREFYLGLSQIGKRKSYREVKHYKRRKRWL
ncbi:MAG: ABC transporter ATP-binding protein [bacterium]